ncbi:condensation domain-containing protein [Micromonospora aurantiaca]|nr:condensation domain-containing protein [Micromonospora aurantiaca]
MDSLEGQVSQLWCEVLDRPHVDPDDNFFDLGGDSLLAIRLARRAQQRGLSIGLPEIFECANLRQFVELATRNSDAGSDRDEVVPFALTPIQQLSLARTTRLNDLTVAQLLTIHEAVTEGQVLAALGAVVARHGSLRSRIDVTATPPRQQIVAVADHQLPVRVVEVPPDRHYAVRATADEARAEVDLATASVAVFRILAHGGRPWGLLAVLHHLMFDGLSWDVIHADLEEALQRARQGLAAQPRPATSMRAWVSFAINHTTSDEAARYLTYWRGRPWDRLPDALRSSDVHPRPLAEIATIRSTCAVADEARRRRLRQRGYETVITSAINMGLVTVLGATATLIDVVINGRDQIRSGPDLSRTVGWLAEYVSTFFDLGDAVSPPRVLSATARSLADIPGSRLIGRWARDHYPDPAVRSELRDMPEPAVSLNLRLVDDAGTCASVLRLADVDLGIGLSGGERQPYMLKVVCDLSGEVLSTQFRYHPGELATPVVQLLVEEYERMISFVLDQDPAEEHEPGQQSGCFPLIATEADTNDDF